MRIKWSRFNLQFLQQNALLNLVTKIIFNVQLKHPTYELTQINMKTKPPDNTSIQTLIEVGLFQLDLTLKQEEGDITSFITNGEWDLISKSLPHWLSVCSIKIKKMCKIQIIQKDHKS